MKIDKNKNIKKLGQDNRSHNLPSFDPKDLVRFTESLLAGLPPGCRITEEIRRATSNWLVTIAGALSCMDVNIENLEKVRQKFSQCLLESVSQGDVPESKKSPAIVTPLGETLTPPGFRSGNFETLWLQLVGNDLAIPAESAQQSEELLRWYCWQLANCKDEEQIKVWMNLWQKAPYKSPRKTDIVIHGTTLTSDQVTPVWIGPVQKLPQFAQFHTNIKQKAQVWLSFASSWENDPRELPQWFADQDNKNLLPMWYLWHDLLHWAIMAPQATVFVNVVQESLNQARDSICKTLADIHTSFRNTLRNSDHYEFVGDSLHRVYSALHQFLLPEDLDADQYRDHVFANLRMRARENVRHWLSHLQIEELYPAGPLRSIEFLGKIKNSTQKNSRVLSTAPLVKNKNARDNQVLYWLKPHWHQKNPPKHLSADLLGSVLYCFD